MKTRLTEFVTCKTERIRVDIGKGNNLFLFKGDRITISSKVNDRNRYAVLDSKGIIIGSITKRDINNITARRVYKSKEGQHALVAQ